MVPFINGIVVFKIKGALSSIYLFRKAFYFMHEEKLWTMFLGIRQGFRQTNLRVVNRR